MHRDSGVDSVNATVFAATPHTVWAVFWESITALGLAGWGCFIRAEVELEGVETLAVAAGVFPAVGVVAVVQEADGGVGEDFVSGLAKSSPRYQWPPRYSLTSG